VELGFFGACVVVRGGVLKKILGRGATWDFDEFNGFGVRRKKYFGVENFWGGELFLSKGLCVLYTSSEM
jgi:hypothetical protein